VRLHHCRPHRGDGTGELVPAIAGKATRRSGDEWQGKSAAIGPLAGIRAFPRAFRRAFR
jgi:hypothetical protein